MVMTDATPMMIPSIVRNARNLLLFKARKAILNKLVPFIIICLLFFLYRQSYQCFGCGKNVRVSAVFLDLSVAQHDVTAAVLGYFRIMRYKYDCAASACSF